MKFLPLGSWPKWYPKDPATGFRSEQDKPFPKVIAECRCEFLKSTPENPSKLRLSPSGMDCMVKFIKSLPKDFAYQCQKKFNPDEDVCIRENIKQFMGLKVELNPHAKYVIEII